MFQTTSKWIAKLEAGLLAFLMLAISILVFLQVVTRYVMMYSTPWLEEATRFLMIWMVMIGGAHAVKTKQNLIVDIFDLILNQPRAKRIYGIAISIIGLTFSVVLIFLSYEVVARTFHFGQVSGAMRIPMYYVNGSFLAASVLMSWHYIEDVIKIIWSDIVPHKGNLK